MRRSGFARTTVTLCGLNGVFVGVPSRTQSRFVVLVCLAEALAARQGQPPRGAPRAPSRRAASLRRSAAAPHGRACGASLAPRLLHRHHNVVAGRMNDALDQRGQRFEGVTLLGFDSRAGHRCRARRPARGRDTFRHVGTDASARQQRAGRPSQIVQRPAGDAADLVEVFLAVVEATERVRAVGAENMIAAASTASPR